MSLPFDHIVVLDFESTCKEGTPPDPQEIIELPSVLVSLEERAVVDAFETFVRPVHHPRLDPFCTELTSIRQEQVDGAPGFLDAYAMHRAWLSGHGLLAAGEGPRRRDGSGEPDRFVFVTCGDWDLSTMLPAQCAASQLPVTELPRVYRRWCNIKKPFGAAFQRDKGFGMPTMLESLGLELQGRHHRGIDDCHNIARIALALVERGAVLDVTGKLPPSRYPALSVRLRRGDEVHPAVLAKRSIASLLGLASGVFRTRIGEVRTADGTAVTDDVLAELRDEVVLDATAGS